MGDQKQIADPWEKFRYCIDLYKFHYDLAIRLSLFYYAITGGILAHFLANRKDHSAWTLLLPILLSVAYVSLFVRSVGRLGQAHVAVSKLGADLEIEYVPDLRLLKRFVLGLGIGFFFMALFMLGLMARFW